jgi:hypothetical protein
MGIVYRCKHAGFAAGTAGTSNNSGLEFPGWASRVAGLGSANPANSPVANSVAPRARRDYLTRLG